VDAVMMPSQTNGLPIVEHAVIAETYARLAETSAQPERPVFDTPSHRYFIASFFSTHLIPELGTPHRDTTSVHSLSGQHYHHEATRSLAQVRKLPMRFCSSESQHASTCTRNVYIVAPHRPSSSLMSARP
jgi:hypothetical protein